MIEEKSSIQTFALVIIATVAAAVALYFGREFLSPIAVALLLNALFRPLVRLMGKFHVPTTLSAAVIVLSLIAVLTAAGFALSGPVQHWFATAPQSFAAAEQKLNRFRQPLQKLAAAANRVEHVTQPQTTQPTVSTSDGASMVVRLFGTTTVTLAALAEIVLLLFLLLSSGDSFVAKITKFFSIGDDRKSAHEVVHSVESAVGRYLLTMLMINLGQGTVVGIVMWLMGLSHPILWGVFTLVLEFIPYLGAVTMICLLGVAALTQFDHLGHILLIPAAYLVITTLQNSLLAPLAYGQRLRLNPVVVLVGVLLWWFLWGVPGAFVAVPLLAATKIIADHSESLRPLGELLGE